MLTSKERSNLRAMANSMQPIYQIGKGGLSDNMIESMSNALEMREMIKITVLQNSAKKADELIGDVASALNAEPVCAIGSKIIIYRRSSREGVEHLKF